MRKIILVFSLVVFSSFGSLKMNPSENVVAKEMAIGSSFSLINDTNDKVSIHTGLVLFP